MDHKFQINLFVILTACLLFSCNFKSKERTWSVYKADENSSSYSPLDQINKTNVKNLEVAWIFNPKDGIVNPSNRGSECNPIVIDGVVYTSSERHRIYAVNANTGEKIWSFDPFDGGKGGGVNRGVTYWEDGSDKRILFTAGDGLYALDAITGQPVTTFGNKGRVNLNVGMRDDSNSIRVIPTSPGIIFEDLIILGTEVGELYGSQPGYQRAYNVRTGELKWTFHTIPHPGEPGYETWPKDAWKYVGGANNWSGMSLDKKRGMVFFGTGSPTYDFYGADRKGTNLFANCIISLDARTGKLIWYYQTVHHDLWDYDLPAPPNLVTIVRDGVKIDAVAQVSKVGFIYVLDRETGEPVYPIEEREVPLSDVPGEEVWPTQPFPSKPAAFSKQSISEEDLMNYSDSIAYDSLVKQFRSFRYEGLFTPPSLRGSVSIPSTSGGSIWGGAAVDPGTGILYVKGNERPEILRLRKIDNSEGKEFQSSFLKGQNLYNMYCASCHGKNREGTEEFPSLINLKTFMNEDAALKQIRDGSGRMPSFATILKGNEKEFIDFLFDKKNNSGAINSSVKELVSGSKADEKNVDKKQDSAMDRYLNISAYRRFSDSKGRPAIKPPWGTLNAIDLNTGDYLWKVTLGNIPELQEEGQPITGNFSSAGPIVTAGGLVFFGGTNENLLRIFDKESGDLIKELELPGRCNAIPATYWSNGKQYIVLSLSGNRKDPSGSLIAFSLSEKL